MEIIKVWKEMNTSKFYWTFMCKIIYSEKTNASVQVISIEHQYISQFLADYGECYVGF